MADAKQIVVPDIGGAEDVDVVEVLVKPGDQINKEDPLVTLESDKATMDIPASDSGVVKEVKVNVGDKVSEGSVLVLLETSSAAEDNAKQPAKEKPVESKQEEVAEKKSETKSIEIKVPDIGTDAEVEVIEVAVAKGDAVQQEATLITLESDKATMDVPSPVTGEITDLKVKVGDKVKQGDLIAIATSADAASSKAATVEQPAVAEKTEAKKETATAEAPVQATTVTEQTTANEDVHAGPAVRRLSRELGVDLAKVSGTGRKGRILTEDVHKFVKQVMQSGGSATGLAIPAAPKVDFAKFGEVETKALSKIKKLTGVNMQRNWLTVPHVTQFDEADITEMEAFRQANKKEAEAQGAKLTPLIFIMKAVVAALKAYPQFNSSLDASGESLIMKKYFHIGVAVDTPNGLVVPVIRNVDQKSFLELAVELGAVSKKARDGKLLPTEMQGGCFTISSLGGIGGTAFTPIVNCPEVAILGVSRSEIKPKFIDGEFKPRLMLPLSLSYDHRVIDGADGARFAAHLVASLTDLRRLLL